jgi:Tfp pilus assembly protein PilX
MTSDPRRGERGAALVIAIIVVLVVTVIGLGVLRIGTREVVGASADARHKALVSCAEAARQLLTGQFHALGLQPTELTALNVALDGASTLAVGGHYDTSGVTLDQVSYLPETAFGPSTRVRDITNVVAVGGQGGKPLKVVVHCQQGGSGTPDSGRQLEVEFGVRFGL